MLPECQGRAFEMGQRSTGFTIMVHVAEMIKHDDETDLVNSRSIKLCTE